MPCPRAASLMSGSTAPKPPAAARIQPWSRIRASRLVISSRCPSRWGEQCLQLPTVGQEPRRRRSDHNNEPLRGSNPFLRALRDDAVVNLREEGGGRLSVRGYSPVVVSDGRPCCSHPGRHGSPASQPVELMPSDRHRGCFGPRFRGTSRSLARSPPHAETGRRDLHRSRRPSERW